MDQATIPGCDDTVHAGFETAYDPASGAYIVRAVTLAGVAAACDGMLFSITVADGANQLLGTATYADPTGPDGQVDPLLTDTQQVRLDLAGQRVRASAAVLLAIQIGR